MIELKIFIKNMHDKIEGYMKYLIKIEDNFEKISHTMIGIQIELSDNWKGSGDIFW